jgi:hypothetical protein
VRLAQAPTFRLNTTGGGMLFCLILSSVCTLGLKFHSTGIFAVRVGTNLRLENMF